MTNREILEKLVSRRNQDYQSLSYISDVLLSEKDEDEPDVGLILQYGKYLKGVSAQKAREDSRNLDVYYRALFALAKYDFDSYLIYMEKDREPKERFYLPRREKLIKIGAIQLLQDLEDDKLDVGGLSIPPGCGKSTLEEFFIPWVIGRDIDCYNIWASHSSSICRMFYDAEEAIMCSNEYKYAEIFPEVKKQSSNAKDLKLNFGKYKPFKSIQCVSIEQKMAGQFRANKYICIDDLVSSIEEAVSKVRLDKLWTQYSIDLLQRRKDKCKELHVCTRWSCHDPVGRVIAKNEGNPRARFIAVPDLDPETGESNFDYKYGVGFSKEYFEDVANTMDDVSYRCLYKNQPIEREGLLYPEDSMRRYLTLPDREPDAIIGICDTKSKGKDYMFLPCFYQYGNDYYMEDCICSDESDFEIQYSRIADIIIRNKMQMVDFESNSGGDRIAEEIEKRIRGKQNCGITMHYTTQNKETKIIVNAEWVKKHCLFKDRSMYTPKSDYGKAMGFITSYTVAGKNAFDDCPDGLAQFAIFTGNLFGRDMQIMNSPF